MSCHRLFIASLCAASLTWLSGAFALAPQSVSVPLDTLSGWQVLSFRNIPPNVVSAGADGLHVDVDASASPLVFPLKQPVSVQRVRVRARWAGDLALPDGARQGESGADDAVLKLGLVESGDQTLNWFQKRIAAKWVRTLFDLAPPGSGIRQIHFLSTTRQPDLVGTSRTHPLSDLLRESRFVHLEEPGVFELDVALPEAANVVALWVSSDGDDTRSRFSLVIESIELIG